MATASRLVLLGPQRFQPTVIDAVRSLGVQGTVAVVTAGWQEREGENDELREHLQCEVIDLLLYHRYDDVLQRDRQLGAALHQRQEQLQQLQELYRLRLDRALEAARLLMGRTDRDRFVDLHRRSAIHAVRRLDRQHLSRIHRVHSQFAEAWQPQRRPAVARHVEQIRDVLSRARLLAVAGGHVAVLLNRLRLFDPSALAPQLPVVAWSAGAMAAGEYVVLFHDSPPQGPGNPEVFDTGLGLFPQLVPLPHARARLRLADGPRVALFARRFAPARCVVLEGKGRVDWNGGSWRAAPGTQHLAADGQLREMATH
jgi:hypothetical protein